MGPVVLDPGQLSARLDLEMRADAGDGQGGIVPGHSVVASLWARIEPVTLREDERVDETVFSVTHRIWIRTRDDLMAGMRFRKGGRVFEIMSFRDPDEAGRYLVCKCREDGR